MGPGPCVLVAEDHAALRDFLVLALREAGYAALAARDGAEALEVAARARPDCILLDVRMPRMDGPEFTRRYREAVMRPAPIVAMSADADARRAMEAVGAAAFVAKPFDLDALLGAVGRQCGRCRAASGGGRRLRRPPRPAVGRRDG